MATTGLPTPAARVRFLHGLPPKLVLVPVIVIVIVLVLVIVIVRRVRPWTGQPAPENDNDYESENEYVHEHRVRVVRPGAVAQSGERLDGIEEVAGAIPAGSTAGIVQQQDPSLPS